MSISTFTCDKTSSHIGGKKLTLTWTTSGATYVTLSEDCYTSSGKQVAGTQLSANTSVYIYPVTDTHLVLTDDTSATESLYIKIGYDPTRFILRGGRLIPRGEEYASA